MSSNTDPISLPEAEFPTTTIAVLEVTDGGTGENASTMAHINPGYDQHRDDLFAGHLGTTNFLFADGHVKSLRPTRSYVDGVSSFWRLNNGFDSNARTMAINAEAKYGN